MQSELGSTILSGLTVQGILWEEMMEVPNSHSSAQAIRGTDAFEFTGNIYETSFCSVLIYLYKNGGGDQDIIGKY